MKKLVISGLALLSYVWIAKKMRDKESYLSRCVKKMEEKIVCMVDSFLEREKLQKKDSDTSKNKSHDSIFSTESSSTIE